MRRTPRPLGFTLIELLVVIAIIGILAGITIPVVYGIRRSSKVKATGAKIEIIKNALSNYETDFGDYPPSTLSDLDLKTNRLNDGIESLVRCLTTKQRNGPYYEFPVEELVNVDSDRVRENFNDSYIRKKDAFEWVDAWGNPFVYIHHRDYERKKSELGKIRTVDGMRFPIEPAKSEKTGEFQAFSTYQIWSLGPNGKNDGGGGDDVVSW